MQTSSLVAVIIPTGADQIQGSKVVKNICGKPTVLNVKYTPQPAYDFNCRDNQRYVR